MSKLTPNLGLHIWEIPKNNKEKFNYKKSVGDNFEKIDESYKEAVDKFTEPLSYKGEVEKYKDLPNENNKNGDIYNVTSENKNYIWNGTEWVEYSSTLDLTYLENNTRTLQTTETAEELEIQDCAAANGKIDIVSGKSWQETRSGKNKFNPEIAFQYKNGSNLTVKNDDGTFTTTANFSSSRAMGTQLFLEKNTDYLVSILINSVITESSNKNFGIEILGYNNSNMEIIKQYSSKQLGLNTFNFNSSDYETWSINISGWFGRGNKGSVNFQNIQVEEGLQSTDYEPYGVMPSPDFPSEIRNVGDNVNLFDKDNPNTLNAYFDGSINQLTDSSSNTTIYIPCKPNTKYVLQRTSSLGFFHIGETSELPKIGTKVNNKYMLSISLFKHVYTTSSDAQYIVWRCSNAKSQNQEIFNGISIKEGTEAIPYTPFGCGSIDFKVETENLFKYEVPIVSNATKMGDIENGYWYKGNTSEATQSHVYSKGWLTLPFNFKSGIKYYLSFNCKQITKGYSNYIFILPSISENGANSKDFTISSNDTRFSMEITPTIDNTYYIALASNEVQITDIMISIQEINEYTEHQEQIVSFPLSEGQVLHEGDYLADDGVHQVRETLELNGTENWHLNSSSEPPYPYRYYFAIKGLKAFAQGISTHFKNWYENGYSNHYTEEGIGGNGTPGSINIYVNDETIGGHGEEYLKSWLSSQKENGTPLIIEYELAEEKITPYTPEQQEAYNKLQNLLFYEGYTRITCIDEMKPDIKATYYFNNEINNTYAKRIDSIEEKLRQLEKLLSSQSEVME